MDADKIRNIAEEELAEGSLFLVEVNITPGNEIEVVIDSDGSVDIDDCVALSRAIEERLDREEEDFELTVTSAGCPFPPYKCQTSKHDLLYSASPEQVKYHNAENSECAVIR